MKKTIALYFCLLISEGLTAQDSKPFTPTTEASYFDFWEGTWYQIENDKVRSHPSFIVSRNVHPAAFSESWLDSAGLQGAFALRVWDKTNEKWMYTWISGNGLYQVWEGRKVNGDWYIYKYFNVGGDQYLSRQGWIMVSNDKVMRISEKSYDEGKSWQLRFKFFYVRR